jgi:hypothetical protein
LAASQRGYGAHQAGLQPIFATRPPAELRLPPLRFPGDDGADAFEGQEEQEEQYEVDKIYAPPKDAYKCWFLTKEDATITIEQNAAENPGSEPLKADYKLWLEASFKGWSDDGKRTRYHVSYDGIAPGRKLEEWNADWGKRAADGLADRIQRDRKALRARKSASARFAIVLPMVENARLCEDQVADEIGGMLSDGHSGKTERQRAYRAWSYIQARDAKTYEREVSDVAKSAISAIGKPGHQAPTVVAPPRDMRMPRTIEEAVNCPACGPQWSQAIADEIAGLDAITLLSPSNRSSK